MNHITDDIIEIVKKKIRVYGNSSHIILPQNYDGYEAFVLIVDTAGRKPYIHFGEQKKIDGKICYRAEISDNAGTHGLWIPKDEIDDIAIRNHPNRISKRRGRKNETRNH